MLVSNSAYHTDIATATANCAPLRSIRGPEYAFRATDLWFGASQSENGPLAARQLMVAHVRSCGRRHVAPDRQDQLKSMVRINVRIQHSFTKSSAVAKNL